MPDDKPISGLVPGTEVSSADLGVYVDVSAAGAIDPAFPGRGPAGTTTRAPFALWPFDAAGTAAAALTLLLGLCALYLFRRANPGRW